MCGLFGLARALNPNGHDLATEAFARLGVFAMERGVDAAGFAVTAADATAPDLRPATSADVAAKHATLGQVTIVKDCTAFKDLWNDIEHRPLVAAGRVAIGHTRWATQGNKADVRNASPLAVGALVGSHNGDIDTTTVKDASRLPLRFGSTDTERLYQAISRDRSDRRKIKGLLSDVEGRAALAWIDRSRPGRLYLARAALSPLSIAFDKAGNLYWASNPDWFRKVDADLYGAIGFHSITMVREGTMLTVDISGEYPVISNRHEFKPICRASDARMGDFVVWRGFDKDDAAFDKAQTNHRVAADKYIRPAKQRTTVGAAFDNHGWYSGGSVAGYAEQARRWWDTEPDVWDEVDTSEVDAMAIEDGEEAFIEWLETGANPEIIRRLREETSPNDRTRLVRDLGLMDEVSLDVFAGEVFNYLDEEADEAERTKTTDPDVDVEAGHEADAVEAAQAVLRSLPVASEAARAALARCDSHTQRATRSQVAAALSVVASAAALDGLVFGANIGLPIGSVRDMSDDALRGVMALLDEVERMANRQSGKAAKRVDKVLDRVVEEYARRLDAQEELADAG